MNKHSLNRGFLRIARLIALVGYAASLQLATALPFTYTNNDLLLGFRKTGVNQENYEVVVDIGSVTNWLNAPVQSALNVSGFSGPQLTPDAFTGLNHLSWSVFGYCRTNLINPLPGSINNTLWLTVPRTDVNIPSPAPNRLTYAAQGQVGTYMNSVGANAAYLSSLSLSNQDNTGKFVREPINNPSDLSAFVGGVSDSTASTFQDTWTSGIESTTPASFTASVVCDLYEVRPTNDSRGNPVVDPHTHLSTGAAYRVGYFQFSPNGTLTFTRSTNAPASSPPPAPQLLSASRAGATATIYFSTTNGATYTLYFTNSSGLGAPVSTWSASPNTVLGDGNTGSLSDVSSDPDRFYKVGAHF